MRLLVTGASGNIGAILGNKLQENNIPFTGIDVVSQGFTNDNFLQLDITNKSSLYESVIVSANDELVNLFLKILKCIMINKR